MFSFMSWMVLVAFLIACLRLAHACSMGLRSGEYGGSLSSIAPVLSIRVLRSFPLCQGALSMMTTIPALSVGSR